MQNDNENERKQKKEYAKFGAALKKVATKVIRDAFLEDRIRNEIKFRYIEFKNGDCFCNHRLIDFPNHESLYFLLVRAVYEHSQIDGFCSYESIDDYFVKHGYPAKGGKARSKRINNALVELYRVRKDQKVMFPETAPDEQALIKPDRKKKGLTFHNPIIN